LCDPFPTVSLAERIRALADVANPASVPVRLLEHVRQTRRLAPDEARLVFEEWARKPDKIAY